MNKKISLTLFYLLKGKHINGFYKLCLEEGYCQDETFNWYQRTLYYAGYLEKTYGE